MKTLLCLALLALLTRAEERAYRVIVHANNGVDSLERKFVADAFLKKATRWPNGGEVIHPVDQKPDARVREKFSEEVLGRSVAAVIWARTASP